MEDTGVTTERYYGQEYADGSVSLEGKSIYDRLREYYSEGDFVTVINCDTQPIRYQFATPVGYETYSNGPGHKDTVQKYPPQVVILQPGQMKLCPAFEADLMIVNLIKQMATRVTERKIAKGEYVASQSTNWSDPILQAELIPRIYKGKQDLVNEANAGIAQIQTTPQQANAIAPTDSVPTSEILQELELEGADAKSKKVKA